MLAFRIISSPSEGHKIKQVSFLLYWINKLISYRWIIIFFKCCDLNWFDFVRCTNTFRYIYLPGWRGHTLAYPRVAGSHSRLPPGGGVTFSDYVWCDCSENKWIASSLVSTVAYRPSVLIIRTLILSTNQNRKCFFFCSGFTISEACYPMLSHKLVLKTPAYSARCQTISHAIRHCDVTRKPRYCLACRRLSAGARSKHEVACVMAAVLQCDDVSQYPCSDASSSM